MNKQELVEAVLFAGLRVAACALGAVNAGALVARLLDAWYRFDPNYLGAFLLSTVLRPVVMLAVAAVLYAVAGPVARRSAARFARSGP